VLSDDVRELARGGNFAVLSTVLPDGQPAAQVMWVDCDDDHVLVNTEVHRRKFDTIQRDPRVTVCIWEKGNPYRYEEVRGRVVEIVRGDVARRHIDDLAMRYFGRLYDPEQITSERVLLRIRPLDAEPREDPATPGGAA
jgi:PPOX class probable F420-dependent enzyme